MSALKRMVSGLFVMGVTIGCTTQSAEQLSVSTTRAAIVNGPLEAGYAAAGAMTLTAPNGFYIGNFCSGTIARQCGAQQHITGAQRQREKPASQGPSTSHSWWGPTHAAATVTDREMVPLYRRKLLVHERYDENQLQAVVAHDLALVRLVFAADVTPYPINRDPLDDEVGRPVTYVGYGVSNADGERFRTERRAELNLTGLSYNKLI